MSKDVNLVFQNHVKLYVDADRGIIREMAEHFSFFAENYKFSPLFKNRRWDGKIRLLHSGTQEIYTGLLKEVIKFCRTNQYSVDVDKEFGKWRAQYTDKDISNFIQDIKIPYELYDYQFEAIKKCINNGRLIVESATGSGKSLIIYVVMRWFQEENKKCLLIVPNVGLLKQMESDFKEYGYQGDIHSISAGVDKNTEKSFVFSTWQSIYKQEIEYFEQYDVALVDEVHEAKAKSISGILEFLNCPYRFGFSGTPDGYKLANKLTLTGLFGDFHVASKAHELMDRGILSQLKIKCLVVKYPEKMCKEFRKFTYPQEIEGLFENKTRNDLIVNLAIKQKTNTLVLFGRIAHGELLAEQINEKCDKPVYYIAGSVKGDEREEIRKIIEQETNCILVASIKTVAKGLNIKNLHQIIIAHPTKSVYQIVQIIGRILRLHSEKEFAVLWDIVDDLSIKKHKNFLLKHYVKRIGIYSKELYSYTIHKLKL